MKLNSNSIIWIIVVLVAITTAFCSCESFEPHPNLTVTNAYFDGQVQVGFVVGDDGHIYNESMAFGEVKEFYLEQGLYYVRLIVDSESNPELSDRRMTVFLSSDYTFCELIFRDKQ